MQKNVAQLMRLSHPQGLHHPPLGTQLKLGALSLALLGLILVLTGATNLPSQANSIEIFLSPDGDDTNSGLSRDEPVSTIAAAHEILLRSKPENDVKIWIASGTYYNQRVKWTFTMPHNSIMFLPLDEGKPPPIFDGCSKSNVYSVQCDGGTWFALRESANAPSNIHFYNLVVKHYGTAISFNGNRDSPSKLAGGNTVSGLAFIEIGNGYNEALGPSTAAIRLVNSNRTKIINNKFLNIQNVGRGSGLIHALYLAHQSDRNTIIRNRFENVSGDAIRLRDVSNNNTIVGNTLIKSGAAGYSDWYCNNDVRSDCTKRSGECPSFENVFRDNVLDGTYQCKQMEISKLYQNKVPQSCKRLFSGAKRVNAENNRRTARPCSLT